MFKNKKILVLICILIVIFLGDNLSSWIYSDLFLPNDVKDVIRNSKNIPSSEELLSHGYEQSELSPPVFRKTLFCQGKDCGYIRITEQDANIESQKNFKLSYRNFFASKDRICERKIAMDNEKYSVFVSFAAPPDQFRAEQWLNEELLFIFE